MDADELRILTSSPHRLDITVGCLLVAQGVPVSKVLEDAYEAGQKAVVEDPQAFGLEVRSC